jgi:hypothetical protein
MWWIDVVELLKVTGYISEMNLNQYEQSNEVLKKLFETSSKKNITHNL